MELVFLLLVGLVVWWSVAKRRREGAIHTVRSQDTVERRIIELMQEFPAMTDPQIAMLIRDELLNARIHDPAMFSWATEETVARLRRTMVIELARRERAASRIVSPEKKKPTTKAPALPAPKGAVAIIRAKNCPHCSKRIRGDAWKCPHCDRRIDA